MKIVVSFEADSGTELRQHMLEFLGSYPTLVEHDSTHDRIVANAASETKSEVVSDDQPVVEVKEEVKADKPRSVGRPRKLPVSEPVASPQPPAPNGAAPAPQENLEEEPGAKIPPETPAPVSPPAEALALKESVIADLMAAWSAGKVVKVRDVLARFGSGAKSFREIDLKDFPAIAKAVKGGALE